MKIRQAGGGTRGQCGQSALMEVKKKCWLSVFLSLLPSIMQVFSRSLLLGKRDLNAATNDQATIVTSSLLPDGRYLTILEPQNQSNEVSGQHKVRPSSDFEAPKL